MKKNKKVDNSICTNRHAKARYEVLEKVECGIMLCGSEVKSLREHRGSLDEAFARIDKKELWLVGFHIAVYGPAGVQNHDTVRTRKMLVHKSELVKLEQRISQKGLTLVPLSAYFNDRGIVKITLGVVRGKTSHDKRQTIKEREHKRDMARAMQVR